MRAWPEDRGHVFPFFAHMVLVLFWWLLVLVGTVPVGFLVVKGLRSADHEPVDQVPLVHVFMAGVLLSATYAMTCSLFAGLGMITFLLWLSISSAIAMLQRSALRHYLGQRLRALHDQHVLAKASLLLVIMVGLLKTSSPSELYDEGGYIMPFIKWLEHYGVVPGMANMEERFGLNSSWHSVSALFSLWWVDGNGLYDLNALLLILTTGWFAGGVTDLLRGGQVRASSVLKLFSLLFYFRNMLTGPRPDQPAILLAEMVLVLAAEKFEDRNGLRPDLGFNLIVLHCLLLLGIKFTAVLIGLLPFILLVRMLVRGVRVPLGRLSLLAACYVTPWTAQNVVISGYLIFPMYQVDVVEADWKVPPSITRETYYYVSEFAKTNARPAESERLHRTRTLAQWVPLWFARENGFNKVTALALLASTLVLPLILLRKGRKLWNDEPELLLLGAVLVLCDVVWFLRTPAFRFGWATIICLIAYVLFLLLRDLRGGSLLRGITLSLFALGSLFAGYRTIAESMPLVPGMLLVPSPPATVSYQVRDLHGLPVNEADGFPCWGTPPPCFHHGIDVRIRPRGPHVRDGFRREMPSPPAQPVAP